jgi:hypothetical protein
MHLAAVLASALASALALTPRTNPTTTTTPSPSPPASSATSTTSTTLLPWQITNLGTFSPSGRPGSSAWATLAFTVTDPNTLLAGPIAAPPFSASFPPSSANCSAEWQWDPSPASGSASSPAGTVWRCTSAAYGPWTFALGAGASTEAFNLTVHRREGMVDSGTTFTRAFVGRKEFSVGANMDGECGGSGVCSWGQREAVVEVVPTQTNCTGPEGYC